MAHGVRGIGRWAQREQTTALRTLSQAMGLTYSVLGPHVVLAAGVQGSCCQSVCLCIIQSPLRSLNPIPSRPCLTVHTWHLERCRPRAKLCKDSLTHGNTGLATKVLVRLCPEACLPFHCTHTTSASIKGNECIKKVRVRGPWASRRTEDAGPACGPRFQIKD